MVTETAERTQQLERRIEELEFKIRYRDEQLASERAVSAKAKKKAKQLLLKLGERDDRIAELRTALEAAQLAAAQAQAMAASAGTTRNGHKPRKGASTNRDVAARERTEIVAQLEGHLSQMRANLAEGEREIQELEGRRRAKEAEWKAGEEDERSVESTQVHWQALSMITQQIQEKRRFAAELTQKTRELEEQVVQQRAFLDALCGRGAASAERYGGPRLEDSFAALGATGSVSLATADEPALGTCGRARRAAPELCEDEALRAFLSAAGPAAEAILSRPLLLAAFEEQPPRLSAESVEGCSQEERVQVLSLFAAWVVVADVTPRAMLIEDIGLQQAEVTELTGTLQTCGAQLDEWDMTRCPASDATVRTLFQTLMSQPLRRLSLSYNALGPSGAAALVAVAGGWADTLDHLSLEMNGLGDSGCREVAGALGRGVLHRLRVLELGWNELSGACAPALSSLLAPRAGRGTAAAAPAATSGDAAGAPEEPADALPRSLQKLGLAGNRLGSTGAAALACAALEHADQALELDMSMNHVDETPLAAIAEWLEGCGEGVVEVAVCINLEWNMVDDAEAVLRLATAAGKKGLELTGLGTCPPLVRLGNNEVANLDVAAVATASRGLVLC